MRDCAIIHLLHLELETAPYCKGEVPMPLSFLTWLSLGVVLFLAPSFTRAGETAATMEAVKGEVKATTEEAKGEAKAKLEEAQGNKMKAMGERAKGTMKAAGERTKGKVKELKAKTE
jgi:hypothetical protein